LSLTTTYKNKKEKEKIMAKISFKISEVKKIVEDLEKNKEFSPTFEGLYDIDCPIKKGVKKKTEDELPYHRDEVDFSQIKPAFHLVKDDGIYLLSNGRLDDRPASESGIISYAKGFDPESDKFVWEKSRDVMGGDDCVIEIPYNWFKLLIKQKPNARVFSLNVTSKSIGVVI